ncbi:p-hydroxyphenylacetate 3-hydroxylase, reductase component [Microbulbifer aggregans]|uniref:p-hydroxyphenylacetate 3-hydroxylase, reductase component n=1 Tax=Microbulbifer aggregans TaxID=1769779 RepID=A0A1C9WAY6_9GAMM|nr:flavin reductase family protein [Microbulbifer aggregans]AOS98309.1 p-hydroxyphenylacetate 3-hydroxylase, reductase component [Microbulbifer aggregans]
MSIEAGLLAPAIPHIAEHQHTVEPLQLRQVFGQFATGVTIVTTGSETGEAVGMTVSSFNTVSLEPPLILWCIDKKTGCFEAFNHCEHFAIHVLSQEQEALSSLFARRGVEKFSSLDHHFSEHGVPLLHEYCARLQCTLTARHEGGDHLIMVGRVDTMHTQDRSPLIFHRGHYARIA